jgi:hypothetical protein
MKEDLIWNSRGTLSPIAGALDMRRSPYLVSLDELVERFATTPARCKILKGFLGYREALRQIGIHDGFQWIDGSFVEDIEAIDNRPPGDIDVVTFYKIPPGETQKTLLNKNALLFPGTEEEKEKLKKLFCVDGMMSSLDARQDRLIKQVVFFYSLWSHRRDQTWKGFVQIDLNGKDDTNVQAVLDGKEKDYGVGNED